MGTYAEGEGFVSPSFRRRRHPRGGTPGEWDDLRSRPTRSYETVRRLGRRHEQVAQIAPQVYERLDGSGYPKGLQGAEILPAARI
ncbi:MAG: hypothetical protein IH849_04985 [Acidobacteria bacterium]|nr:hypothetical protein [Acidobacteriota bacterium]